MSTRSNRNRIRSAAALLAVGLVVTAAVAAGGGGVWTVVALAAFYVVAALALLAWSSRSDGDIAALVGGAGDERQRGIDVRATAVAGLAMGLFSLVMAIAALARGDDNAWLIVCLFGAFSYTVALAYLKSRS